MPLLIVGQSNITVSGGDAVGDNYHMSYSFGQVFYSQSQNSNYSLSKGVQQVYDISTIIGQEEFDFIKLQIKTFPNPTTDNLYLSISPLMNETFEFLLTDMNSKVLKSKSIEDELTQINMENLPASVYFLSISNNNAIIKVFKVIKN